MKRSRYNNIPFDITPVSSVPAALTPCAARLKHFQRELTEQKKKKIYHHFVTRIIFCKSFQHTFQRFTKSKFNYKNVLKNMKFIIITIKFESF